MFNLGIKFSDVSVAGYDAARRDMPADLAEDGFAEVSQTVRPAVDASPLDIFAGRMFDEKPAPEAAAKETPADRLQNAFNEARGFQQETVKLETGKMTAPGAQGAGDIRNYAEAKAEVAGDLKKAVGEIKQELKKESQPAAPQAEGGKGVAGLAASAAAGALAEAIIPGSGIAMTVAAIGAGTLGAKGPSHFGSPASEKSGQPYHTAKGYDGVDVMQASFSAPAPVTSAINAKLSSGPGFGMGEIKHILEPSLEDTKIKFSGPQLDAMAAMADRMQFDAKAGRNAFKQWQSSDLDVTSKPGDAPVTSLKLSEKDQVRLTSDNPALRDEPMLATPKISAAKLVA